MLILPAYSVCTHAYGDLFFSMNSFSCLARGGSQAYTDLGNCEVTVAINCCLSVPLKSELYPPAKQMGLQIKNTDKISRLFKSCASKIHSSQSSDDLVVVYK